MVGQLDVEHTGTDGQAFHRVKFLPPTPENQRGTTMKPLRRKILTRLTLFTGLMTAAVVVYTFWERRGPEALLWGLGAGAAAAGLFVLWFLWKESRPRNGED